MRGLGLIFDFPRTLRPSKAHEHAMTPPGKSKEEAVQMADDFISSNINNAITLQNNLDPTGSIVSLLALVEFGKASHTMMDGFSPTHRFFQPYSFPTIRMIGFGGKGAELPDFGRFLYEGIQHKNGEATITSEERENAISLMRINLLTGLGRGV